MDDDRTQQTLDDLAELFLTGTTPVVPPRASDASAPVRLRPKPASPESALLDPEGTPADVTSATPAAAKLPPGPPGPTPAAPSPPPADPRRVPAQSRTPALRLTQRVEDVAIPAAPDATNAPTHAAGVGPEAYATPAPPLATVAVADEPDDAPGSAADHAPEEAAPRPRRDGNEPLPPRPALEAVLLGNVPGFAQAWLTQYAQLVAQRDGPVLLLTVDADTPGGVIEAELVEPSVRRVLRDADLDLDLSRFTGDSAAPRNDEAGAAAFDTFDPPPLRLPPERERKLSQLLNNLLRDAHAPVSTVLIHTDNDPAEIGRLLDVGVWTLLTGADETALHAGAESLRKLADAHPEAPAASVGVFVLGSPEDKATFAADALIDRSLECFDAPLDALGHLQKMRPAACRTLGHFPGLDAQWDDLFDTLERLPIVEETDAPSTEAFTEPEPTVVAIPPSASGSVVRDVSAQAEAPPVDSEVLNVAGEETPVPSSFAEPARPTEEELVALLDRQHLESDAESTDASNSPGEAVDRVPSDASRRIAAMGEFDEAQETTDYTVDESPRYSDQHQVETAADLPTLLTAARPLLALRPLQARCPDHPAIDLALDADGQLHLLHRMADGDAARASLLALRDTRRWAVRHRELLALAAATVTGPGDAPLSDTEPATHLFTDRPDQAVPLAASVDPTVRLHLLQHLDLAAGPSWLATPLQA